MFETWTNSKSFSCSGLLCMCNCVDKTISVSFTSLFILGGGVWVAEGGVSAGHVVQAAGEAEIRAWTEGGGGHLQSAGWGWGGGGWGRGVQKTLRLLIDCE